MKSSNISRVIAKIAQAMLPPSGLTSLTSGYVLPNHKKRRNRGGTGKYRPQGISSGSKMAQRSRPESRRGCDGTMRR